jgi:hypothetical protein
MVHRSCSSDGQSCGPTSGAEAGCLSDSLGEIGDTAVEVCSANAEEEVYRAPTPFAWQLGRQLLLLDENPGGFWQMAELEFEPIRCHYIEVRRASYIWFREALGALMSRALASGEAAAEEAGTNVLNWYDTHHAPVLTPDAR